MLNLSRPQFALQGFGLPEPRTWEGTLSKFASLSFDPIPISLHWLQAEGRTSLRWMLGLRSPQNGQVGRPNFVEGPICRRNLVEWPKRAKAKTSSDPVNENKAWPLGRFYRPNGCAQYRTNMSCIFCTVSIPERLPWLLVRVSFWKYGRRGNKSIRPLIEITDRSPLRIRGRNVRPLASGGECRRGPMYLGSGLSCSARSSEPVLFEAVLQCAQADS